MNIFNVIITAVLATLATLVFGVVAVWSLWPTTAEASVNIARHASGWHGTAGGDHCAHLDASHIRIGEAVIQAGLELEPEQEDALRAIAARLESLTTDLRGTCQSVDMTSLDAGLLGVEQALSLSATAVAEIRPLVTAFYDGLSVSQRETLQKHLHRHRQHRDGRRHGFHGRGHGVES